MILSFDQIYDQLKRTLLAEGFGEELASLNARIFSESTRDGYHSHGVNRFVEFVNNVRSGIIDPTCVPTLEQDLGVILRYNGHQGPGPSNAYLCMQEAIRVAREKSLACIALNNTNHWMRGGGYGWQAAENGCIGICFTNTMPNMPPWGGKTISTGNNPLIIAVPRQEGHVVLDMSLSQFSYGKLYQHRLKGTPLPFAGGYDDQGHLTTDPEAIISSRRILQTGYWKGSGLSIMLDLLATLLSAGLSTAAIGKLDGETKLSQVFLCIDQSKLGEQRELEDTINDIVKHFTSAEPQDGDQPILFPGASTMQRRKAALQDGIAVDDKIWEELISL